MSRPVIATITEPSGQPREGLLTYFHAPPGHAPVTAEADASGVIRPELETGITYRVSVENAVVVDGVTFPAGTVILVQVPEGAEPATAPEVLAGTVDASRPALLDTIASLTTRIETLEAEVQALQPAPEPEPAPEGGG